MHMKSNYVKLRALFETFEQRVRPVTQRTRKMLGAKTLAPISNRPSQQQVDEVMDEFSERVLPMFDQQLEGKNYFCGDEMTGYDLQVYCEIKSIRVFAELLVNERLKAYSNVIDWMKRIENTPDVVEIESEQEGVAFNLIFEGLRLS